MKNRLYAK